MEKQKKEIPLYVFSQIPMDNEGEAFIKGIRKHLNRGRYKMRVKGQGLKEGYSWSEQRFSHGAPLKYSTHMRVYIDQKETDNPAKNEDAFLLSKLRNPSYNVEQAREAVEYFHIMRGNMKTEEEFYIDHLLDLACDVLGIELEGEE